MANILVYILVYQLKVDHKKSLSLARKNLVTWIKAKYNKSKIKLKIFFNFRSFNFLKLQTYSACLKKVWWYFPAPDRSMPDDESCHVQVSFQTTWPKSANHNRGPSALVVSHPPLQSPLKGENPLLHDRGLHRILSGFRHVNRVTSG